MYNSVWQDWVNAVVVAVLTGIRGLGQFLPNVLAAIIIFVIGWVVAGVLEQIAQRVLKLIQLEPFAEKVGLSDALKKVGAEISINELLAQLVKWAVVLLFLSPAVEILGLSQVTEVLNRVLLYIPNVFVAVLIVMFGVIFADLATHFVRGGAHALGTSTAGVLAVFTRYAIITFVILAALSQLGIAQQLVATLFTGLVAMLAIAGGLAFGLGGKEIAADILHELRKALQEKR